MHIFRSSFALLPLLVLSGCVQPTSQAPTYSQQELSYEQQQQQAMVDKIKSQGGQPKNWQSTSNESMKKFLTRVAQRVETSGATLCKELGINRQRECYYNYSYKSGKEVNAYADGQNIVVSTGMMGFVESDDELAMVISHEFAHNLFGHPDAARQNATAGGLLGMLVDVAAASQGLDTQGGFGQIGANAGVMRYSQGFEAEADYIGMYILARAGYNIQNVANFWRRMSIQNPDGIYTGSTHPTTAARFIAINKTVREIEYKQQNRLPLIPAFKPQKQ